MELTDEDVDFLFEIQNELAEWEDNLEHVRLKVSCYSLLSERLLDSTRIQDAKKGFIA